MNVLYFNGSFFVFIISSYIFTTITLQIHLSFFDVFKTKLFMLGSLYVKSYFIYI